MDEVQAAVANRGRKTAATRTARPAGEIERMSGLRRTGGRRDSEGRRIPVTPPQVSTTNDVGGSRAVRGPICGPRSARHAAHFVKAPLGPRPDLPGPTPSISHAHHL